MEYFGKEMESSFSQHLANMNVRYHSQPLSTENFGTLFSVIEMFMERILEPVDSIELGWRITPFLLKACTVI
jgi:hypothetical protein